MAEHEHLTSTLDGSLRSDALHAETNTDKSCSFATFVSCNPSEYYGSFDPAVTLDWLRDTERKLEICQCEEKFKVPFAVQFLKGQAMFWWDSITANMTSQQRASIQWSEFHNEVCRQYCSEFDVSRIQQEFMELKLTDEMTIDELITKFTEKLRFAQQCVPDDKSKVYHFVRALPPEYRATVRLANSLADAFALARLVDNDLRAQNKEKTLYSVESEPSDKGKHKGRNRKMKGQSGLDDRSPWCNDCKSRHMGKCTSQTVRCIKCGLIGHKVRDCGYPNKVCWNCQQEGHHAGMCPEEVSKGTGLVGVSSSSGGHKRKKLRSAADKFSDDS